MGLPLERIGPYQVLGYLGEGGMGQVHKARAPGGKLVAVKVVRPAYAADPEFRARFQREVASAMRVPRFCTAEVLGAAADGDLLYLVTEFIDGPTLHAAVREDGPWEAAGLEQLGVSTAAALVAIHGAGVIHRDLKPSNVLLSRSGPRVIDFGVARALDVTTPVTATGQVVGTPGFVAPEQYQGDPPTPAVDVFAWGGVMTFAATGRYPFGGGDPSAVAYRVVHGEPDLGGLEGVLRELVAAALSKDPSARPAPASLQERLGVRATPTDAPKTLVMPSEPAPPEEEPSATAEAGPATPRPEPSRRSVRLGLAGVVLAIGVAAAALAVNSMTGGDDPPAPTSAPTSTPPAPEQVFTIEIPGTVGGDRPGPGAGSLARPGDTDVYRFTGARDERVFVEALPCDPVPASAVLTLEVTGPDGPVPVDRPELCRSGEPVDPGALTLPADGDYELVVRADGGGTATYGLRLRHPDLERLEIAYGQTVAPGDPPGAGEIAAPGDIDIYHLQGQAGDQITLTAEDCRLGAGALRYIVWEPGATGLVGVVAVGDLCARGSGGGQATATLPVTGEYQITLDAAGHGDTGTYRLTVTSA